MPSEEPPMARPHSRSTGIAFTLLGICFVAAAFFTSVPLTPWLGSLLTAAGVLILLAGARIESQPPVAPAFDDSAARGILLKAGDHLYTAPSRTTGGTVAHSRQAAQPDAEVSLKGLAQPGSHRVVLGARFAPPLPLPQYGAYSPPAAQQIWSLQASPPPAPAPYTTGLDAAAPAPRAD